MFQFLSHNCIITISDERGSVCVFFYPNVFSLQCLVCVIGENSLNGVTTEEVFECMVRLVKISMVT